MGRQRFSAQRAAHELETERTRHDLEQDDKDQEQRRYLERKAFWFVLSVLGVALIAGFAVAVEADNSDTRRWGQGLLSLLIGAIAGAVGGYLTGRRGQ